MRYLLFLLLISASGFTQPMTSAKQKALNSYVDYANQSADETTAIVRSLIEYYPTIHQKSSWGAPRYTCPVQMEEYYLNNALALGKTLDAGLSTGLNAKLRDLRGAAEKIDSRCKALDTYHKLEDYKQDNFVKAVSLINELQLLVGDYKKKQDALWKELEGAHKKLAGQSSETPYAKADLMLRSQIANEKAFLDVCSFNLNQQVHTGWPVDKLQKSIAETDAQLLSLKKYNPTLKYPASSMWTNFQESLASMLEVKRTGLDAYNFEAKKSDVHSNEVYLSLINYFNGTLISDQNTFVQFAAQDNYFGLKALKYFPLFEIRNEAKEVEVVVKAFKDIPYNAVNLQPQKTSLPKSVYTVLANYIDYINETWRQTRYMKMVLVSFNSTASYYKSLSSYDRVGGMSFDYENYKLPLSQYQKTISDSKILPPSISKTLNDQSEVLMNILKEMDDLAASLESETSEKRYEKDHLDRIYKILEREKELMDVWDQRKEMLYTDVRKVYDAYPPSKPADAWFVSGRTLQKLTDLDHDGLFQAKSHYSSNGQAIVQTVLIDEKLREVIASEYENMKGIQKYGRSNGLCPYTPYEDLPVSSKSLSEELKKLKPAEGSREHPYHRMVYHYNDVVEDYNKFCELSKDVLHLQSIHQPELFTVQYPGARPENVAQSSSSESHEPVKVIVAEVPAKIEQKPVQSSEPRSTETLKVQHDTVYIEKRDTVYLAEPGENLRSMEGYASNNMVLLLDVSGSMNAPEKLPLLKASVLELLSMMRQEDKVSIIAFSEKPKALLTATSFKEEAKIRKAISDLKSSGKTDGNAGVKLAYKVADENYLRGGNNRIILATDGEFAMNDDTRQLIDKFSREDVYLSVFNFGKGAGSSRALERLAELGKGNYRYISKENVSIQLIREVKAKKKN